MNTEAARRERLAAALELVALVEQSFPSARFTDEHRQAYAADVAHLDPAEAKAAVEVLKRTPGHDGRARQFAPTAGDVALEVARLQLDAPDWGEVKRQLVKRQEAIIAGRDEPDTWVCPFDRCDGTGFADVSTPERPNTVTDCECRPARTAARTGADELHPLLREFISQSYVTWGEVAEVGHGGATTLEAQMRGKWDAFAHRAIESRAIAAIGAPPTLRRLDEAREEDAPRRRRELGRVDFDGEMARLAATAGD
jgi:hypothetical protein